MTSIRNKSTIECILFNNIHLHSCLFYFVKFDFFIDKTDSESVRGYVVACADRKYLFDRIVFAFCSNVTYRFEFFLELLFLHISKCITPRLCSLCLLIQSFQLLHKPSFIKFIILLISAFLQFLFLFSFLLFSLFLLLPLQILRKLFPIIISYFNRILRKPFEFLYFRNCTIHSNSQVFCFN